MNSFDSRAFNCSGRAERGNGFSAFKTDSILLFYAKQNGIDSYSYLP